MSFFNKILNKIILNKIIPTKQEPLTYNLPTVIQNSTINNPYYGKYRDCGVDNAVHLLYVDYSVSERWIKDARKPDTFFSNYIKAVQILTELNYYVGKYRFEKPTPKEQLNNLKSNYAQNVNAFILRFWGSTQQASDKLKTQKSKQNRIDNFFSTLLNDYNCYLVDENIKYIEHIRVDGATERLPKFPVSCKGYDINSINTIKAISNNDYEAMRLLQKAATNHKRNGNLDLAVECLKKSNAISDTLPCRGEISKLTEKEYLRIISYTKLLSGEQAAKEQEEQIKVKHPEFWDKRISNKRNIDEQLKKCIEWNIDLVEAFTNTSCKICSAYNRKIYSLSGKDKNYPKLPDEFRNQTHSCPNCIASICLYFSELNS